MNILHLKNYPIYQQLQLEEALLRLDHRNFCLINEGSTPAIVMGISCKPEELIHFENPSKNPTVLIKRFSGGGTVVVDEDTLFITFICERNLHDFAPYPEPIMRWTEEIYNEALKIPDFSLQENDYVIGMRKFGGNAQYLRKERWLHHSTLLWDYKQERMDLLLSPKKMPKYRAARSHEDFLTPLSAHLQSKEEFLKAFKKSLQKRFSVKEISLKELLPILDKPHRKSTEIIHLHHLC